MYVICQGKSFILSSPLHFMKGGGGVQSSPRAKWGALQEIYLAHKGNCSFLLCLEVYWYILLDALSSEALWVGEKGKVGVEMKKGCGCRAAQKLTIWSGKHKKLWRQVDNRETGTSPERRLLRPQKRKGLPPSFFLLLNTPKDLEPGKEGEKEGNSKQYPTTLKLSGTQM